MNDDTNDHVNTDTADAIDESNGVNEAEVSDVVSPQTDAVNDATNSESPESSPSPDVTVSSETVEVAETPTPAITEPELEPESTQQTEADPVPPSEVPPESQPEPPVAALPAAAHIVALPVLALQPTATESPQTPQIATPATPVKQQSSRKRNIVLSFVVLVLVGAALFGSYRMGITDAKSAKTVLSSSQNSADLRVPDGATIVSQCTAGVGTQYVLPKDIPYGPIYNVYQGKVIGLEFMTSTVSTGASSTTMSMDAADGSAMSTDMSTWSLVGQKYDHINASLMPIGHAGLNVPHVMMDIMTVPTSVTDKITCGGNSSSTSTSSTTSSSDTTMH